MFVVPDEEGPGALLESRSSRSLIVGSTFVPTPPLPPDARAALCSGRLNLRTGDVDLAGIRPGHGAPSARLTSERDRKAAGRASWRRRAGWLVGRERT
jgi:hypothetical protein